MPPPSGARKRTRGEIEPLPSGSLRVRVYAGIDPLTKKRLYLIETVPAGRDAARQAEKVRTRLLGQVDERRNPRTKATVGQLMDQYMKLLSIEATTRRSYEGYLENYIRPALGDLTLARLDGEILDSFYARLRTCRRYCGGRKYTEHWTARDHKCDKRCRPHECKPLADSSIRQIHNIVSGACKRAVRWRWISVSPMAQTEPPSPGRPDPRPPTPEQAARIANEAWTDLDWGMLVWLAMMTGARRGELCALAWDRIDFDAGVLTIRSSIAQLGTEMWEKHTKTHQQRRIVLDERTLGLLRAYLRQRRDQADQLGLALPEDARVFSPLPDGSTWIRPDAVSQRYRRMCARLGWNMNIHQLRHYSATELIASGVDVRTVAGRLGHGGGGSTTLRVYSAWVSEADQRAAGSLADRMPILPANIEQESGLVPHQREVTEDSAPYLRIAADLRAAITCGALRANDPLPTVSDLAKRYDVAPSTAHRAIANLAAAGLVAASRGKRATVR